MLDEAGSWLVVDTAADVAPSAGRRGIGLVRVVGEIDLGTRDAFEAGLERVLARDPRGLVFDCSAMSFCGAGGLAVLMRTTVRGVALGTGVAVVGLSPRLQELCARFWPGPQPTSCSSVSEAVRALAGVPTDAPSTARVA